MGEETKKQVLEMSIGIIAHNLVLFFICMIWFRSVPVLAGNLVGMIAAVGLLCSMAHSTELCVEAADENYAKRKMTIHAVLRSLFLFAAIVLLWKFLRINLLSLALGIMGLKTGAYLYPAVHKFMNHRTGKKTV